MKEQNLAKPRGLPAGRYIILWIIASSLIIASLSWCIYCLLTTKISGDKLVKHKISTIYIKTLLVIKEKRLCIQIIFLENGTATAVCNDKMYKLWFESLFWHERKIEGFHDER